MPLTYNELIDRCVDKGLLELNTPYTLNRQDWDLNRLHRQLWIISNEYYEDGDNLFIRFECIDTGITREGGTYYYDGQYTPEEFYRNNGIDIKFYCNSKYILIGYETRIPDSKKLMLVRNDLAPDVNLKQHITDNMFKQYTGQLSDTIVTYNEYCMMDIKTMGEVQANYGW